MASVRFSWCEWHMFAKVIVNRWGMTCDCENDYESMRRDIWLWECRWESVRNDVWLWIRVDEEWHMLVKVIVKMVDEEWRMIMKMTVKMIGEEWHMIVEDGQWGMTCDYENDRENDQWEMAYDDKCDHKSMRKGVWLWKWPWIEEEWRENDGESMSLRVTRKRHWSSIKNGCSHI